MDFADEQHVIWQGKRATARLLYPPGVYRAGFMLIGGGVLGHWAGEPGAPYVMLAGAGLALAKTAKIGLTLLFDRNLRRALEQADKVQEDRNGSFNLVTHGGRLVNRSELKALQKADKQKRKLNA